MAVRYRAEHGEQFGGMRGPHAAGAQDFRVEVVAVDVGGVARSRVALGERDRRAPEHRVTQHVDRVATPVPLRVRLHERRPILRVDAQKHLLALRESDFRLVLVIGGQEGCPAGEQAALVAVGPDDQRYAVGVAVAGGLVGVLRQVLRTESRAVWQELAGARVGRVRGEALAYSVQLLRRRIGQQLARPLRGTGAPPLPPGRTGRRAS